MDEWKIGDPVDWGDGWMDAQNWGHGDDEMNPDNIDSTQYCQRDEYSRKAWDCYLDSNYDDALRYIDLALDLDRTHPNNWNIKGIIYDAMGIYGKSEECFNRSLDLAPSSVVSDNKARMLKRCTEFIFQLSKDLPNHSYLLDVALERNMDAINALPKSNSKENLDDYLAQRDKIKNYIMQRDSQNR